MNGLTPLQRWEALTPNQQQYLEDFIIHDDFTQVDELKKLGLVILDERDQRWMPTIEGLACYAAGTNFGLVG